MWRRHFPAVIFWAFSGCNVDQQTNVNWSRTGYENITKIENLIIFLDSRTSNLAEHLFWVLKPKNYSNFRRIYWKKLRRNKTTENLQNLCFFSTKLETLNYYFLSLSSVMPQLNNKLDVLQASPGRLACYVRRYAFLQLVDRFACYVYYVKHLSRPCENHYYYWPLTLARGKAVAVGLLYFVVCVCVCGPTTYGIVDGRNS